MSSYYPVWEGYESGRTVHVVVVATDPTRLGRLFGSLKKRKGYEIHVRGLGEEWTGYEVKLRHTLAVAKQLRPDDVLVHLDAYDTYVVADADEVYKKFMKRGGNTVLVSTETNLAPNHELDPIWDKISSVYPEAPNRYRWINSGTYMGRAGDIVRLLDSMPKDFRCDLPVTGQKMRYADDQRCFHTALLGVETKHLIKLDHQQDVFYCLYDTKNYRVVDGRVKSETGSEPCFLHGNGSTPVLDELIGKIDP